MIEYKLLRPQSWIFDANAKNRNKLAILNFFSAIIELVREILIINKHNKFGKKKLFKLSCQQVNVKADATELQLQ